MERHFPGTQLRLLQADIAGHLTLPPLDGIVAANAIHYIPKRNMALLQRWKEYLQPEGRLIAVEYDTETGNRWVPYPMSYAAFQELARAAGFTEPLAARDEAITVVGVDLCRSGIPDCETRARQPEASRRGS